MKSVRVIRRDERGAVLPLAVIVMTVMIGFAGFGVDIGWWYSRAVQIQRAADAASLAGVVWMPDTARAQTAAQESLRSNGIVAGGDISVTYTPVPPQRYRVTVRDAKVESYFTKIFQGDIQLNRKALAEYLLAVPLGSPLNHFGTPGDNIYASINGFCTSKEDGDEVASRFDGTKPAYNGGPSNRCPSGVTAPAGPGPNGYYELNSAYERPTTSAPFDGGYSYYVDLPANRTSSMRIALFDAAYFNNTAASPDLNLATAQTITTTYRLRQPDSTPLDDTDNAIYSGCGGTNPRSFATNDSTFGLTLAGSSRFTSFCTIPTSAPAGKYILDVYTAASQATSVGSNAYGIWVQKGTSTGNCDANTDSTCPRVYGRGQISLYANQSSGTADFYLAQISPQYAGKQMVVKLWDPGEGGSTIQLLNPAGTAVSFNYFTEDGVYSGNNVTSVNVSGTGTQPGPSGTRSSNSKFNDRKLILTTVLPATYPASWATANHWWKIRYTFSSGTVTDRTTWTVNVLGQPVHLVAE